MGLSVAGDYVFWPIQQTELNDKTKKRNKDRTVRQTVDVDLKSWTDLVWNSITFKRKITNDLR